MSVSSGEREGVLIEEGKGLCCSAEHLGGVSRAVPIRSLTPPPEDLVPRQQMVILPDVSLI